jgi:hypothetical protein
MPSSRRWSISVFSVPVTTELQVICLFRSSLVNTLHGSLTETNERLKDVLVHRLVGQTMPPGGSFWTAEQLGRYDKWRTGHIARAKPYGRSSADDGKLVDNLRTRGAVLRRGNSARPARMTSR